MESEEKSLRDKATSGLIWSAFERFGQQGCAFVIQIILARLLAPEEFGLIAMVAVFIAISNVLIDAGFGRAIIQRKNLTDIDASSVFYFNLIISVLLAALLCYWAPYISAFYDAVELTEIVRYLSVGLVFSGLGAVHKAKLSREMKFKRLFVVSFPATVIAGVLGVILAINGAGVWALVAQSVLMKLVMVVALWLMTGWRPLWAFDINCIKEMFPYGSRLALSGLLDTTFSNIYVLVIGKAFTPLEVGLFQRARSFQQLPVQNLQAILGRVTFPLFSKIQDDPVRMKSGMRKAIQILSLFVFCGMALLAGIAEPMVITFIGDKWLPCVPYLQALCVVGAMYPIHAMNLNLLASVGRSDLFLRLEVIKKLLIIINILITFRIGIQAMIYGMMVTSILSLLINTYYTKRLIDYSLFEQVKDVFRNILIAAAVLMIASMPSFLIHLNELGDLFLRVGLGALVFVLGIRFLEESLKSEMRVICGRIPYGNVIISLVI